MKKILITVVAAAGLVLGLTQISQAVIINPGFETGNINGWTANNAAYVSIVTTHAGDSLTYLPQEGSYFARLVAGQGPGAYTTLSQLLSVSVGESLTGYAAFDARDSLPHNDDAYVRILDSAGALIATPWSSNVSTIGNNGDGPWTVWTWTATQTGSYTILYGTANQTGNSSPSYALFDAKPNVTTATTTPEPASLSLLGLGIFGLLGYRRKS
jgi:hypothetical protein